MANSVVAVPVQWEYCFVTRKSENAFLIEINSIGAKGWELISVLYYKDMKSVMCWTGFFKRPCGQTQLDGLESSAQAVRSAAGATAAGDGFDLSDADFGLEE
jgi:hypothetical protein